MSDWRTETVPMYWVWRHMPPESKACYARLAMKSVDDLPELVAKCEWCDIPEKIREPLYTEIIGQAVNENRCILQEFGKWEAA